MTIKTVLNVQLTERRQKKRRSIKTKDREKERERERLLSSQERSKFDQFEVLLQSESDHLITHFQDCPALLRSCVSSRDQQHRVYWLTEHR